MADIERVVGVLLRHLGSHRKNFSRIYNDFIAELPEDDDELIITPDEDLRLLGQLWGIHYIDAKDQHSKRRVEVHSLVHWTKGTALQCFCYERQAARSFYAHNIQEMTNLETGEIIENPLEFISAVTASDVTAEAIERASSGLAILSWIAICDGHLHEKEWGELMNYVDYTARGPDVQWPVVEVYVRALSPSSVVFKKALNQLRYITHDDIRRIIRTAIKIIHADGTLAMEEQELLETLLECTGEEI